MVSTPRPLKLAYVIEDVANPRNRQRFGIDFMVGQGLDVRVIEISGLTFPKVPRDRRCYEESGLPFRLDVVKTFTQWRAAAAGLAEADFIISLVSTGGLDPRSIPVYRGIAAARRPYGVLSSNAFPGFGGTEQSDLPTRLKAMRPLHSLAARLQPSWLGIPAAALVVYGGEKSKTPNRFVGPDTSDVWAHAMDYETFLAERDPLPADRPYAVFIDEYHPYHPDVIGMGGKHPTPPDYYFDRLRKFFDRVEAELGIEVVIAACPRAEYDDKPRVFGARRVEKFATAPLVSGATLVLAHRSTAIAFAIMFDKPVLQIAHRTSYEAPAQKPYFDAFSEILGKPIRFIDDPASAELAGVLDIDRDAYDRYKRDYLKRPGSAEKPYWRIVLDAVQACCQGGRPEAMTKTVRLTSAALLYACDYPSTENLELEQKRLIEQFNHDLASGTLTTEAVPCLCGSSDFVLAASYDRYRLRQDTVVCRTCGLVQSNPRLTAEEYRKFYESDLYRRLYSPALMSMDRALFDKAVARDGYRFAFVMGHLDLDTVRTVLEVGCGGGWNLWPYHQAGKTVLGLDHSPALTAYGAGLGMDLRQGSIEDIPGQGYDLIVLSHVVEHFMDPVATVRDIVAKAAPGGHLYIEVPNADHFELGGLQNAHTYWFSPQTLFHYMAKAGLRPLASSPFGCHFGALFVVDPGAKPAPLPEEYDRIAARIKRYERRQSLKHVLKRLGILRLLGRR